MIIKTNYFDCSWDHSTSKLQVSNSCLSTSFNLQVVCYKLPNKNKAVQCNEMGKYGDNMAVVSANEGKANDMVLVMTTNKPKVIDEWILDSWRSGCYCVTILPIRLYWCCIYLNAWYIVSSKFNRCHICLT